LISSKYNDFTYLIIVGPVIFADHSWSELCYWQQRSSSCWPSVACRPTLLQR